VIGENSEQKRNFEADVLIIGGGLAGLISSILLRRKGQPVTLVERKRYPFHRVCGEYISNETVPFLRANGLFPEKLGPENIKTLQLTSVNGRDAEISLDMGGFGISRYAYDQFLYEIACSEGVNVICDANVEEVKYKNDSFIVKTSVGEFDCRVVIGAHGKRSKLDYTFDREFIHKRSPYVGVKYHVRIDHKPGLIALHNFKDGYCGISNVEDGKTNLCYLTHRKNMKEHGNIRKMEEEVLFRNPFLKSIFERALFLFEKPEVINEISFETKKPVEDHVLMVGDAAGMITPLCGNGMAMAIHSAKIASKWLTRFSIGEIDRAEMEAGYSSEWSKLFANRLWTGRQVQRLFGSEGASNFAVDLVRKVKPVANFLVKQTHGDVF